MAGYKDDNFSDRMNTAAKAKRATLEKYRARPGPTDPAVIERQAARKAISDAREVRAAARQAARQADAARQAIEEAGRVAEQLAREAEEADRVAQKAARDVALQAQRKAARGARY